MKKEKKTSSKIMAGWLKNLLGVFTVGGSIFRVVNIQTRLVVSFLFISLIPLAVISTISNIKSSSAIESKISSYSSEVVNQLSKNINTELAKIDSAGFDIVFSEDIQVGLNNLSTGGARVKLDLDKKITRMIATKAVRNPAIYGMQVYVDQGNTFKSQTPNISEDGFADLQKLADSCKEGGFWSIVKDSAGKPHLLFTRKILSNSTGKSLGMINIFVKPELFDNMLKEVNLGTGSEIIVMDSKGTIISSSNSKSEFGSLYREKSLIETVIASQKNFSIKVDGNEQLIAFSKINSTEYYLIAEVPYSFLNSESNSIRNIVLIIAFICLLSALVLSIFITTSISDPLKKLVGLMKEAKNGNLRVKINDNKRDEIALVITNFNDMVGNISNLVSKVNSSVNNVLESAEEIATSSTRTHVSSEQVASTIQEIAKGASQQAVDVAEGVGQLNILSKNITEAGCGISSVAEVVFATQKLSEDALLSVKTLNEKAMETTSASVKIIDDINSLNKDMKQIQNIVKVIVGISEQTNLLSLNAAIEAARAGEAGAGFAVVADEVRKLAERSKESSFMISNIISTIKIKAELTVKEANNASEIIGKQMEAVKVTDQSFKTIYNAMEGISQQIQGVDQSVKEVIKSKEKVLDTFENVSSVSQETAATSQEVAASTQEQFTEAEGLSDLAAGLQEMAKELNHAISIFKVN